MPTILFIRHGQASFGTENYDRLSKQGIEQAAATAEALSGRPLQVARIVSGNLARQRDTATPAARAFGIDLKVDPRWTEYDMEAIIAAHHDAVEVPEDTDPARRLSSRTFQDILEQALAGWFAAGLDSPAPESWPAFHTRVTEALQELADSLPSRSTALVFSSGGVIATVAAALLGLDTEQLLGLNRVAINAAVTKVAVGSRGLSLIAFNDHGHLEALRGDLITYR